MRCDQCGAEVPSGARFCASCGTPLGVEETKESKGLRERARALAGTSRRDRWLALGTVIAVIVAVIAFLRLDEGGFDDPEFLAAADAQCLQAKEEIATAGQKTVGADPGRKAQSKFVGSIVSSVTGWRLALEELAVSDEQREASAGLRDALFELSAAAGELNAAVRRREAEKLGDLALQVDELTSQVEAEVDALGLSDCGSVSLRAPSGA